MWPKLLVSRAGTPDFFVAFSGKYETVSLSSVTGLVRFSWVSHRAGTDVTAEAPPPAPKKGRGGGKGEKKALFFGCQRKLQWEQWLGSPVSVTCEHY